MHQFVHVCNAELPIELHLLIDYFKTATAAMLDFIGIMNVFNKTFANAQRHSLYPTINVSSVFYYCILVLHFPVM